MAVLVLLPVFLLAAGAGGVAYIAAFRPGFRSTWLVVAGVALLAWAAVLGLRWLLPDPLVIPTWLPLGVPEANELRLVMDQVSWPYALSLTALLNAVVLTGAVRLTPGASPWPWAGMLGLASMSLLAILAGSPLALLITWTAIDLVDLVVVALLSDSQRLSRQAVIAFSTRATGTVLVVAAMITSLSAGEALTFDNVQPLAAVFLLAAAGLRLGVLPLNLPYTQILPIRRDLGTLLRFAAPASSLPLLARLPAGALPEGIQGPALGFALLACLYGAAMWLAAEDGLAGRPFWLVSLAGLAVAATLLGSPLASIAWGVALLLSGGMIFLYSTRLKGILLVGALSGLALSGLPFTPSASGWVGLAGGGFDPVQIAFVLTVAMLLAGFIRHLSGPVEEVARFERWIGVVYPLGLLVLPLNQWIFPLLSYRGALTMGVWWASLAAVLLSVGILALILRRRQQVEGLATSWLGEIARRAGLALAAFFRLDWLYRVLWAGYQGLQGLAALVRSLLEGQGGVIWALVLLSLLVSLINLGVEPR
ncbi:MAG TPA: hypothetical protein GYA06_08080 [Chloroflexi bacterium]|nr:hypothetical protein [Chloroflexota bacterium]